MYRAPVRPLLAAATALGVVLILSGPAGTASAAGSRAPGVVIDPAALSRGADTTLLHTEGRTIVSGSGATGARIRADVPSRPRLVGRAVHGYVVITTDRSDGSSALWRVRPDGSARLLRELSDRASQPHVSPRGDRVAWTVPGSERTRLLVARISDGTVIGSVRRAGFLEVADVGRRQVLVTGVQPARTLWFRPASRTTTKLSDDQLWQADIAADRAVAAVPDPAGPDGVCVAYRELRDPSVQLWRSCTDVPLAFSTDRAHMVTTDIQSDGIGPSTLEVRDAAHNTPLASYTTDGGYFGDPVWEDDDSFVVRVWAGGHAAQVRITTAGAVERVSRVAAVPAENFRTLWWTFADE